MTFVAVDLARFQCAAAGSAGGTNTAENAGRLGTAGFAKPFVGGPGSGRRERRAPAERARRGLAEAPELGETSRTRREEFHNEFFREISKNRSAESIREGLNFLQNLISEL